MLFLLTEPRNRRKYSLIAYATMITFFDVGTQTTIGIPILIILLHVFTAIFAITPMGNPPESIRSGHYGQPPKTWWWFKQSIIYFLGLMGMKICVLVIFLVLPWISRIGDWALRWTEGNEQLQVFFVMLFFPVVMNATQYYIIDSFIKSRKPADHEALPSEDGESDDGTDESDPFDDPMPEDIDDMESEDELPKKEAMVIKADMQAEKGDNRGGSSPRDQHNYDPQFDGENSPTVVGSSSNSEREQPLDKDADGGIEAKAGRR